MNAQKILSRQTVKLFSILLALLCLLSVPAKAEILVPEPLKPWVGWVLERNPERDCAFSSGEALCSWPGKLALKLTSTGGEFTLDVTVKQRGAIALPGGRGIYPLQVRFLAGSSESLAVILNGQTPVVELAPGSYSIEGNFSWSELPKSLQIPVNAGLVSLEIPGRQIDSPRISKDGELWLEEQRSESVAEEDTLQVELFRRLADGSPFSITTAVSLRAAGKAREVNLGKLLIPGSALIRANSVLPYRISVDGELFVQLKPGEYLLNFEAVVATPPQSLTTARIRGNGFVEHETWAWAANERLRSVELEGVPSVDPSRTRLPAEWRNLPAYILGPEDTLKFTELRRGEREAAPNSLDVRRVLYLDQDGVGFTAADTVSGTLNQGWRLNAAAGLLPGRVSLAGEDQLITADALTKQPGVELRQQNLNLSAESKIESAGFSFPAVGWNHDANSLQLELNLPPGWTLLEAVGADSAPGSWLSSWSLLDLFLVILVSITFAKLIAKPWGVLVLVYLVLAHQDGAAPRQIFIHLLASLAMMRAIPEGTIKKFVGFYFYATLGLMALLTVAYTMSQLREALYPQLAGQSGFEITDLLRTMIEESFLGWFFFLLTLWGLAALFIMRQVKQGLFLLFLAFAGGFVYASTTALFSRGGGGEFGSTGSNFKVASRGLGSVSELAAPYQDLANEYSSESSMAPQAPKLARRSKELVNIDPNATVQTGPGLPTWRWRSWNLGWNGLVSKDRLLELYLISPGINRLLSFARVGLLLGLVLLLIKSAGIKLSLGQLKLSSAALVGALCFGAIYPGAAQAQQFPTPELLDALQSRLMEQHCKENCVTANQLRIRLAGQEILLEVQVSALDDAAWPIPGPLDQFLVSSVKLNGVSTTQLRRDKFGFLLVHVPRGVSRLEIGGRLSRQNSLSLQFAEVPLHVEFESTEWDVDGLSPTGAVEGTIQLTRKLKASAEQLRNEEAEVSLPEWYVVTREISLAMPWEVITTVQRLGGGERPAIAKIPVLFDKAATTEGVKIEGDYAIVSFARGVTESSWRSILEEKETLELLAQETPFVSEVWKLRCSAIFECASAGLAPISTSAEDTQESEWQPFPGEKVQVRVARPLGVEGQTVTIDDAKLAWTPSGEMLRGVITLDIRSSKGGFSQLLLPAEAIVQSSTIDLQAVDLRPDGSKVSLPLKPGKQQYMIAFQLPWSASFTALMPEVKLSSALTNATVTVDVSERWWLLFVGGPAWGPAILFWSKLIAVIIFAVLLGYSKAFPLSTTAWVLLGLGLGSVSALLMVIPVLWFVALKFRKERPLTVRGQFNVYQLILVFLTLLTLAVLYQAVWAGLIIAPNMEIVGNGSSNWLLQWYVDFTAGEFPQPWLVFLPIWAWRAVMLLWSSWMVFALLRWLKFAFGVFSEGGMWRAKESNP